MKKPSQFEVLVDHINENEMIYRSHLNHGLGLNMRTCDTYRRKLKTCGYLEVIKPGLYKRIKDIPEGYSASDLSKDCYLKGVENKRKAEELRMPEKPTYKPREERVDILFTDDVGAEGDGAEEKKSSELKFIIGSAAIILIVLLVVAKICNLW